MFLKVSMVTVKLRSATEKATLPQVRSIAHSNEFGCD